ncbi:hypothetical protein ADUPG1_006681, partial [Aduncisulcus paluster]
VEFIEIPFVSSLPIPLFTPANPPSGLSSLFPSLSITSIPQSELPSILFLEVFLPLLCHTEKLEISHRSSSWEWNMCLRAISICGNGYILPNNHTSIFRTPRMGYASDNLLDSFSSARSTSSAIPPFLDDDESGYFDSPFIRPELSTSSVPNLTDYFFLHPSSSTDIAKSSMMSKAMDPHYLSSASSGGSYRECFPSVYYHSIQPRGPTLKSLKIYGITDFEALTLSTTLHHSSFPTLSQFIISPLSSFSLHAHLGLRLALSNIPSLAINEGSGSPLLEDEEGDGKEPRHGAASSDDGNNASFSTSAPPSVVSSSSIYSPGNTGRIEGVMTSHSLNLTLSSPALFSLFTLASLDESAKISFIESVAKGGWNSVRVASMRGLGVSDSDLPIILQCLTKLHKLEVFDIIDNNLSYTGICQLCTVLVRLPYLTHLHLSVDQVEPERVRDVHRMLYFSLRRMERLVHVSGVCVGVWNGVERDWELAEKTWGNPQSVIHQYTPNSEDRDSKASKETQTSSTQAPSASSSSSSSSSSIWWARDERRYLLPLSQLILNEMTKHDRYRSHQSSHNNKRHRSTSLSSLSLRRNRNRKRSSSSLGSIVAKQYSSVSSVTITHSRMACLTALHTSLLLSSFSPSHLSLSSLSQDDLKIVCSVCGLIGEGLDREEEIVPSSRCGVSKRDITLESPSVFKMIEQRRIERSKQFRVPCASIELYKNEFGTQGMEFVCDMLLRLRHTLKHLHITHSNINAKQLDTLSKVIPFLIKPSHSSIYRYYPTSHLHSCPRSFPRDETDCTISNVSLTHFTLQGVFQDKKDVTIRLSKALSFSPEGRNRLQFLEISDNWFSQESFDSLFMQEKCQSERGDDEESRKDNQLVPVFPSLRTLSLPSSMFIEKMCPLSVSALGSYLLSLHVLDLSDNCLKKSGSRLFCDAVLHAVEMISNLNLEEKQRQSQMELTESEGGEKGHLVLQQKEIGGHHPISTLICSSSSFSDSAMFRFLPLRLLRLEKCKIGVNSITIIGDIIHNFHYLQEIRLSGNNIKQACVAFVKKVCQSNIILKKGRKDTNQIEALVDQERDKTFPFEETSEFECYDLPYLHTLDLSFNKLSIESTHECVREIFSRNKKGEHSTNNIYIPMFILLGEEAIEEKYCKLGCLQWTNRIVKWVTK